MEFEMQKEAATTIQTIFDQICSYSDTHTAPSNAQLRVY